MPKVFNIADDILIAGFFKQGKDHSDTLDKVLWVCRQANLKLNKGKCLFRCTCIPFFDEVISQQGVGPDARKVQALTEMLPPKCKKEPQSFLDILNHLSKFWPAAAEVCQPLWKLTSVKADWTWNGMFQDLYDRLKNMVKM